MATTLPSLNALRAFEAAARHLSFTRAADELFVTQAAVSHQIKHLETQLDVQLFRRLNRALMLTDAGQALLPSISEGFQLLADGVDRIAQLGHENRLVVSTLESIASEWLVQRLGRFRLLHPEIDVMLSISDKLVDFQVDDVDVGIRYGPGNWPKVIAEKLTEETIFPVLAPELLETGVTLTTPKDLLNFTLFREQGIELWSEWFAAAGMPDVADPKGPLLPHSNLVLGAVIAGDGVALGRSFLISGDLKNGRLVRPFEASISTQDAYYLVYPQGKERQQKVRAFHDWLLDEVALTDADLANL
jgi:LysR family transcriptional regulator, glycine cleavage system transcriptional activator